MTWEEYKKQASRTMVSRGHEHDLRHLNSGIGTELFELQDIFKRYYAYGKEIDLIHVKEELGDVYWYEANRERLFGEDEFVRLHYYIDSIEDIMDNINKCIITRTAVKYLLEHIAKYFNLELSGIWEININKLKARFPEKFNFKDALNRDLDNERKILEQ
jgi:NTP pyrophosphatase (non-canonical NTP hydrolase)